MRNATATSPPGWGNVLDHHGQARPLDFDDAAWDHYALDLAITVDSVTEPLHPVLLDGYQVVRPLPDGYQEHTAALLAGRRLFLAVFLLAHGLPATAHLDLLRAFTAQPGRVSIPSAPCDW